MIPLRVRAESNAAEPFIARLRSVEGWGQPPDLGPFDLALESATATSAAYAGAGTRLVIEGIDPSAMDGDVVFVVPSRMTAHRLVRASSDHNTFLITERCDQLCVMCSQPPKEQHIDMFSFFETAALLAPRGATLGISGGEPTLYKRELLALLDRTMALRPDLRFHVLSNAQHFESGDLNVLRELDRDCVLWGVPLYSHDAEAHDTIVGKRGAHSRLMSNLALLAQAGCRVELRTVVMADNAHDLPTLARLIAHRLPFIDRWAIMQLENIGYGRMNWKSLFFDHSSSFEPIGRALDYARSRGLAAQLYNFPLCTVPEPYRHLAPSTISDWKRSYKPECAACRLKDSCSGFFEWHPRAHGYERLGPLC